MPKGGLEWLKACCSDPKAGIQARGRDSGVEACNRVKEFSHVWGSKAKLWSTLKARSRILKIDVFTNRKNRCGAASGRGSGSSGVLC